MTTVSMTESAARASWSRVAWLFENELDVRQRVPLRQIQWRRLRSNERRFSGAQAQGRPHALLNLV